MEGEIEAKEREEGGRGWGRLFGSQEGDESESLKN